MLKSAEWFRLFSIRLRCLDYARHDIIVRRIVTQAAAGRHDTIVRRDGTHATAKQYESAPRGGASGRTKNPFDNRNVPFCLGLPIPFKPITERTAFSTNKVSALFRRFLPNGQDLRLNFAARDRVLVGHVLLDEAQEGDGVHDDDVLVELFDHLLHLRVIHRPDVQVDIGIAVD